VTRSFGIPAGVSLVVLGCGRLVSLVALGCGRLATLGVKAEYWDNVGVTMCRCRVLKSMADNTGTLMV